MHVHIWQVLSGHSTSTGTVTYSRCHCGTHTILLKDGTKDLLAAVVER